MASPVKAACGAECLVTGYGKSSTFGQRCQKWGHKLEASTLNPVYANYEEGEIWALDLGSLLSINQGVKEVCVGRVAQ